MKTLIIALTALAAINIFAAPQMPAPGEKIKVRHMTPEMRKHLGERIPKPGSQKGKVAIINTQDVVPEAALKSLAADNAKLSGLNIVYEKSAAGAADALKAASKADIAIVVVADDKTPALLSAVEDGWAVVNVKKLEKGLNTPEDKEKFFNARCQKEILRAFVSIGGGLTSQYPGNILAVTRIEDLDLCETFIPVDRLQVMTQHLSKRGVSPLVMAHYRQACKQGWAPAPTNDAQRAIWNKVHATPDKPIKIEFDPKRDAGK